MDTIIVKETLDTLALHKVAETMTFKFSEQSPLHLKQRKELLTVLTMAEILESREYEQLYIDVNEVVDLAGVIYKKELYKPEYFGFLVARLSGLRIEELRKIKENDDRLEPLLKSDFLYTILRPGKTDWHYLIGDNCESDPNFFCNIPTAKSTKQAFFQWGKDAKVKPVWKMDWDIARLSYIADFLLEDKVDIGDIPLLLKHTTYSVSFE